jgi:putative hydrolase of the HAD superfamily
VLVRAVSLDAAGTIIRIKDPVAKSYTEIANQHGIPVDEASIRQAFRTVFPRMSPLAFGKGAENDLQRQERDWWKTLVRNCLGRFGQHRAFNGFLDELYHFYAQHQAWSLYDDVLPLLNELDALAIPVTVVSNFDSRLHQLLHGFEIHDRFRAVLCSSEVGSAKPDGRIYQHACEILQASPAHVLHAGDDRRADYEGALNAGLQAQWLVRDEPLDQHNGQNNHQIASLHSLIELVSP